MIGAMIDELSDEATRILRRGAASSVEEAVDLAMRKLCYGNECGVGGLDGFFDDVWNVLTGKPQSWYTNVSRIQSRLSVVLAGITAIGSDAWSLALSAIPSTVDDYDTATGAIQNALTSIIVTQNHVPDDATISAANDAAGSYESQLSLIQSVQPADIQARVRADQAQTAAGMPSPMASPSDVGKDVFVKTLQERANALGQGIIDWTKYAAWAAGVLAALYGLSKISGGRHAA